MPKTEPSEPSDRDLYAAFAGEAVDVGSRHLLATVLERTVGLGSEAIEFGRFELGRKLGAGGMGVVYEARDPVLERKIALKVLRRRTGDQLRVALHEAELMAGVVHDNVVHVHEVGMDEGQAWIVMELVEGTTLRRWQRESSASWRQLLDVYVRAGRGLAAAHERGLVHGDFKPDNVLVGGEGEVPRVVKVTDFGLAHGGQGEGRLGGTPEYMAPEQYREGERDQRSEQFSFCVALFEVLAGVHPYSRWTLDELTFTVRSEDPDASEVTIRQRYCRELAVNMARGDLRWPRRPIRIPRRLRRALERGLAVEPERRFGSMGELLEAIDLRQARRVRVRWSAAAGVGIAMGVAGTLGLAAHERAEECREAEERFEEVWDDDVRAELERSQPAAAGELGLALDRYKRDWMDVYDEACTSKVRTGEWSAWLPVRECLERRLEGVEAVVQQLGTSTRPLTTVNELATRFPAACRLDAGTSTPSGGSQEELARIQRLIASAFADEVAQRYDVGLAKMKEAIEAAGALGYEPLLAESYLQRGRLRVQQTFNAHKGASGWDVPGIIDLERAEVIAERSSSRSVFADAWIFRHKALAVAGVPEHPGDENSWANIVPSDLVDDQKAEWLEVLGLRAYNRGLLEPVSERDALDRAYAWYVDALALRDRIHDGVGRAKLLENMGNVLLKLDRFADGLGCYEEAFAFWRERGDGEGYLASLYAYRLNAMMMTMETIEDQARVERLVEEAFDQLAEDAKGQLGVLLVGILAGRGRPSALVRAEQAMATLRSVTGVDRLHEIQLRIHALGALVRDPDGSDRVDDIDRWLKDLDTAFDGGRDPNFTMLPPDTKAMAWAYIGRSHLLRGKVREARAALMRAHEEIPALGMDAIEHAHLDLDLAETLAKLGDADEARRARERAKQKIDALIEKHGRDEPPLPALRERLASQEAGA